VQKGSAGAEKRGAPFKRIKAKKGGGNIKSEGERGVEREETKKKGRRKRIFILEGGIQEMGL